MDEDIKEKYLKKLDDAFSKSNSKTNTKDYEEFRKEQLPKRLSLYEKCCRLSEKILQIDYDKKKVNDLNKAIASSHLQVTPKGVASFALFLPLVIIIFSIFFFSIIPILLNAPQQLFFLIFFLLAGLIIIQPLNKFPFYVAENRRMQASNQMVLCIFYLVTYMRHTSNIELAIDFASEHLNAPLNLDMRKILWDIETEKFSTIRESLDNYLEGWKDTNMEFIESIHLIEGSLLETTESRRIEMLDKSLSVMLDETYEKMLHYAHDLKSPLTTLHMLGIILPILTLVILPLIVGFMSEVKWYYLFMFYDVALPIAVYVLGKSMLNKRPNGYGSQDSIDFKSKVNFKLGKKILSFGPLFISIIIFSSLFLTGLYPFMYHLANPGVDFVYNTDNYFSRISFTNPDDLKSSKFFFLGYRAKNDADGNPTGDYFGPFGLGATLFSIFIPLALGLSIGFYYRFRSKKMVKLRSETKKLEREFSSALFQLGNRLADGIPSEIAFSKVANVLQGTQTGKFFEMVSINISKLGLNVERAIFDEKNGAINKYKSPIIESSMKVLVESSKKGPLIASRAIITVSEYIKEMHRVDERLKDLMADVISSMKSQVNFLTPIITAIVVGLTSMITKIMGLLSQTTNSLDVSSTASATPGSSLVKLFGSGGIPTYFFQIIVGVYVVELAYILTILISGIENGVDPLSKENYLGNNMIRSVLLYAFITIVIVLLFNMIAGNIMNTF